MSALTCIACMVGFSDADSHRQHYKSDWHRYNLKRKIMELPPVSVEAFSEKVAASKLEAESANADTSMFCEPCRKRFGNKKAYENHLPSKKHQAAVVKFPEGRGVKARKKSESVFEHAPEADDTMDQEDEEEVEEVDSDEWEGDSEPIPNEDCVFCSHHSRNIQANLSHMMTHHSFFIPDLEYLTDVVDFMSYLGRKVGVKYRCLWCDKRFRSLQATQNHMDDSRHCKIRHEGDGLAEYSEFYDYSASYPDANEAEVDDEDAAIAVLDSSGFELTLPSGATVGHRSLLRYYKQRIPNRTPTEISRRVHGDVMSSYRMKGWTPMDRKLAVMKARDIKVMNRTCQKHWERLGWKANKLQHHFRAQTNF